MVSNHDNRFPDMLEQVLLNIWGINKSRLDKIHLEKTRRALSKVRAIYRHRGEKGAPQPSKLNYKTKLYRAGYLAAFGERHAYLSFLHLNKVNSCSPESIPLPRGRKNELVITSLGAGACIELFGLCLYFLKETTHPLYLRLNSIDKARDWTSNRHYVYSRVLKTTFPKLEIDPLDINLDLRKNAIPAFAQYYDRLAGTDILLIYNVINEIPTSYTKQVWKNIKFLLDNFQKPTLILMMEPSAERAEPRINRIKELLASETNLLEQSKEEEFYFETSPICIEMDKTGECLNYRLFGVKSGGSPPSFQTKLKRSHMSCVKNPHSPLNMEQIMRQISSLGQKRSRRGAFISYRRHAKEQLTFGDMDKQWE